MQLLISNFEVIASGTIVHGGNDKINFNFNEVNPNVIIEIIFIEDRINSTTRFEINQLNLYKAELSFINFNNILGNGTVDQIHLLNINGFKYYLRFMSHYHDGAVRVFHYTWLKGENV